MRAAWFAALLLCSGTAAAEGSAPSLEVRVDGLVQHPQSFAIAELKAMPAASVHASFTTMHGQDSGDWTGVPLWNLVTAVGLRDEPGRRTTMRHVLMVKGTDAYSAAVAVGEIDPMIEGKTIVLAYAEGGAPLASLRLIVPGDKHGARSVHDVSEIEIK